MQNSFQVYTVPDCKWCDKAKNLADELGYDIEELDWYSPSMQDWINLLGWVPMTAPVIFVDGEYIGGCVDFIEWTES
jgi:glutaredoxin